MTGKHTPNMPFSKKCNCFCGQFALCPFKHGYSGKTTTNIYISRNWTKIIKLIPMGKFIIKCCDGITELFAA